MIWVCGKQYPYPSERWKIFAWDGCIYVITDNKSCENGCKLLALVKLQEKKQNIQNQISGEISKVYSLACE